MRVLPALVVTGILAIPAAAEDAGSDVTDGVSESDILTLELPEVVENRIEATLAPGAVLRGLDKVSGALTDMELRAGERATLGRLEIRLDECRFPTGNPSGDAYALIEITENSADTPIFDGWMIASSPALNALDHARYDVWVLRCITP